MRFLLQLLRGVAIQNLLNLCQGLGLILLHQDIQRQQFQVVVLQCFGLDGFAILCANLDLQCAAFMVPAAGRKLVGQFGTGLKRNFCVPLFVLRVGLPVESAVGVVAMLVGNHGEDCFRIWPAAIVDGAHSVRV